jgi:3-deoxy-7-phosphoheptulonate synthase
VNDAETTIAARRPDPRRLLRAYDASAAVLAHLGHGLGTEIWTSHEALLPEYERPLVREGGPARVGYGSSGHLLWIGERTRALDSPQVRLLAALDNPIGVKLGPTTSASDLTALIDRLDPGRQPGRLVLIARLGAGLVEDRLPGLVQAATTAGARPVWLCDPMHGNTVKLPDGRKTRAVPDIEAEVRSFVAVLTANGRHAGGLHLETTPDDVTECVDQRRFLTAPRLPRYRTACDPRLNPRQAAAVTVAFGTALTEGAAA